MIDKKLVPTVQPLTGDIYDCTCGGTEHDGHTFACMTIRKGMLTEYKVYEPPDITTPEEWARLHLQQWPECTHCHGVSANDRCLACGAVIHRQ